MIFCFEMQAQEVSNLSCASQDKLGSKDAVLRNAEASLNKQKSVVVDNQNRDKGTRAAYFDYGVSSSFDYHNFPKYVVGMRYYPD